ncbi:unnamed protein product [Paramecium pentaurelia]|uniref:Uncharacterized protein n=1 Tax=Paramecium pentaurelia TaxID=43138 RepID=A0A8S1UNN6_9CILI|nr:unnamed protein product [Paramecium pentaurelia]
MQLSIKLILVCVNRRFSLGNTSKSAHKQWDVLGNFKESTQRQSSLKYLIGILGDDCILQFQLFSRLGRPIYFRTLQYQQSTKLKFIIKIKSLSRFWIIVVSQYPQIGQVCLFTPAYRPELNAIEHMFR